MLAVPVGLLLVNVGVSSLVISSLVNRPLSLAAFRFGKAGADGAAVSIVIVVVADDADVAREVDARSSL